MSEQIAAVTNQQNQRASVLDQNVTTTTSFTESSPTNAGAVTHSSDDLAALAGPLDQMVNRFRG
ncbi:MAG: hypothetical protein GY703_22780 [Gammaproteobacteria bacterium]|nr:hypothetical protein [Gammaproteobacteria bacterium]